MDNDPKTAAARMALELKNREIGDLIGGALPKEWGYALLIFEFGGPDGIMSYTTNANREDMIRALENLIDKLRNHTVRSIFDAGWNGRQRGGSA